MLNFAHYPLFFLHIIEVYCYMMDLTATSSINRTSSTEILFGILTFIFLYSIYYTILYVIPYTIDLNISSKIRVTTIVLFKARNHALLNIMQSSRRIKP